MAELNQIIKLNDDSFCWTIFLDDNVFASSNRSQLTWWQKLNAIEIKLMKYS